VYFTQCYDFSRQIFNTFSVVPYMLNDNLKRAVPLEPFPLNYQINKTTFDQSLLFLIMLISSKLLIILNVFKLNTSLLN